MITQEFLLQFEMALLRAYARASRQGMPADGNNTNFVNAANSRNSFMTVFMKSFEERNMILEHEIKMGGHSDPANLLLNLNKMIENKLNTALYHQSNQLTQEQFQQILRELKKDVRNVFYDGYLGKK
jgi:hypothetical protein